MSLRKGLNRLFFFVIVASIVKILFPRSILVDIVCKGHFRCLSLVLVYSRSFVIHLSFICHSFVIHWPFIGRSFVCVFFEIVKDLFGIAEPYFSWCASIDFLDCKVPWKQW